MFNPSNTLSSRISWIGSFLCSLNVKCLSRIGVSKHSVSMSSLAAAYTLPALASTAHCASASVGATMYGTPMSFSSRWHSALCSLVTRTVRRENFSTSSAVPVSLASSSPSVASCLRWNRFASSPDLSLGGAPSNTYSGLMPLSTMRSVR